MLAAFGDMVLFALSRRAVALIVLLGSAALLGWLLFAESDEQRILANLQRLALAVGTRKGEAITFRTARLNGVFKELLAPDVTLDAPELERAQGIKELGLLGASAPRVYGDFEVGIGESDVQLDAKAKRATVSARVTLTGSRGGELRRDSRTVHFHLAVHEGQWKVYGIQVAAATDEEPEARP
jgi:hypothetical protein